MKRAFRAAHRRIWLVLGPALLLAVLYAALLPSVTPTAELPAALDEVGK